MSSWKKAAKVNQRTHRERHQPEARKHLGLLEKKKDYKKRADDYNEKQATLKSLKQRALNRNPDEFYHHMINSKIEDGMHFEKEKEDEDTPEQKILMATQDLKYVTLMRTKEQRKIERLQARLHLTGVETDMKNKHVYFKENLDESYTKRNGEGIDGAIGVIPDVALGDLKKAAEERKALYKQLLKRIQREKELAITQRKLEVKRAVDGKSKLKPKKIKRGTNDSAPVYQWKYERKK